MKEELRKLKATEPKKKDNSLIKARRRVKQDLINITVLMVGGDHKKLQRNNQEAIEARGGKFLYLTGDETTKTIQTTVVKANLVIVYTQSIGHKGMHEVKAFCKEYCIPISFTKNIGTTGFVRRVKERLKRRI